MPSSSGMASSRPVPSRGVEYSQICLLAILVMGFLLIFSYQSETHIVSNGGNRPNASDSTRGIAKKSLKSHSLKGTRSDVKAEESKKAASRSKDKLVLAEPSENVGIGRKLESNDSFSSDPSNSSNVSLTEERTPPPQAPRPPAKNKYDKKWKGVRVEAYMPQGKSVQSNTLSHRFQFVIKVLALNNDRSLIRCLNSLSVAEYAGDTVDIHIYIDHFELDDTSASQRRLLADETEVKPGKGDTEKSLKGERIQAMNDTESSNSTDNKSKLEDEEIPEKARILDRIDLGGSSVKRSDWKQVEKKLSDARNVLTFVESFEWKFGKKVIHYRTQFAGSQSQWVDAWWPSHDDEFALFVEDDSEVSPLFYRYSRALIATYYYNWTHYDKSLFGISLQRPQIVPGRNGRPVKVDDRTRLFKYQMVGIYGQIFFPKPWKEFRTWYDSKKSHNTKPVVEGMLTTDWYKEFGEKLFTPWFVKFAYNRGYFNLYTNFLRDRVLGVSHRNGGKKSKKYAGCDSVLIWLNGTYDIDLWHMAANWQINKYDFCFKDVRAGRYAYSTSDAPWVLDSTQVNRKILMVSTFGVPGNLVRNWLCKLRKLGIQNYLFIGEDLELLDDLARRGHATMQIENKGEFEEHIEFEVNAISTVLNLGYEVWFIRADTIWVGNPLVLTDTEGLDVIGLENPGLDLFYIRSAEKTTSLWNRLKLELSEVPENVSRIQNWETVRKNFVKACEEEELIKMGKLQQVMFLDGDALGSPLSISGGSADGQVVMLSVLRSSKDWEVEKKVRQLNLWNLDEDLACSELIC